MLDCVVWGGSASLLHEYNDHVRKQAETVLAAAGARATELGVRYEPVYVADRYPAEAIMETASARGSDLIVMASHGRGGLNRLLIGSQTNAVITPSRFRWWWCAEDCSRFVSMRSGGAVAAGRSSLLMSPGIRLQADASSFTSLRRPPGHGGARLAGCVFPPTDGAALEGEIKEEAMAGGRRRGTFAFKGSATRPAAQRKKPGPFAWARPVA